MSKASRLLAAPPYAVERALKTLGANLRTARLRRKLTLEEVARALSPPRITVPGPRPGVPNHITVTGPRDRDPDEIRLLKIGQAISAILQRPLRIDYAGPMAENIGIHQRCAVCRADIFSRVMVFSRE